MPKWSEEIQRILYLPFRFRMVRFLFVVRFSAMVCCRIIFFNAESSAKNRRDHLNSKQTGNSIIFPALFRLPQMQSIFTCAATRVLFPLLSELPHVPPHPIRIRRERSEKGLRLFSTQGALPNVEKTRTLLKTLGAYRPLDGNLDGVPAPCSRAQF